MTPSKLDLPTIWRGCDYPPITFRWKDHNGNPIDLSDWTPHAQSINVDFHPAVTNAATGETQIALRYQETGAYRLGVEQWDWIWTFGGTQFVNNVVPPILSGTVKIKDPITDL